MFRCICLACKRNFHYIDFFLILFYFIINFGILKFIFFKLILMNWINSLLSIKFEIPEIDLVASFFLRIMIPGYRLRC